MPGTPFSGIVFVSLSSKLQHWAYKRKCVYLSQETIRPTAILLKCQHCCNVYRTVWKTCIQISRLLMKHDLIISDIRQLPSLGFHFFFVLMLKSLSDPHEVQTKPFSPTYSLLTSPFHLSGVARSSALVSQLLVVLPRCHENLLIAEGERGMMNKQQVNWGGLAACGENRGRVALRCQDNSAGRKQLGWKHEQNVTTGDGRKINREWWHGVVTAEILNASRMYLGLNSKRKKKTASFSGYFLFLMMFSVVWV